MTACAANASRRCSSARASMGCAWIPPPGTWPRAIASSRRTRNSANSSTATTCCPSFRGARLPRHLPDASGFLANLGGELLRACVGLQDAERRQPCRDRRRLHGLLDRIDQRLPGRFRDSGRRKEAEPNAEQLVLIAELAHRRQIGEFGDAARAHEAAERSGFEVRAQ